MCNHKLALTKIQLKYFIKSTKLFNKNKNLGIFQLSDKYVHLLLFMFYTQGVSKNYNILTVGHQLFYKAKEKLNFD